MTSVDGAAAADLAAGRPVTVQLADGPVELAAEEVELRVRAQPGFAVLTATGPRCSPSILALDDDLRRRGLAREVVRNVQDLRKETGLDVSDTIHLHLVGLDDLAPLFDGIAREVLAVDISTGPGQAPATGRCRAGRRRVGALGHGLGKE